MATFSFSIYALPYFVITIKAEKSLLTFFNSKNNSNKQQAT
jgi:hypothetical protein